METQTVSIRVNGKATSQEVEPRLLLVHYLRDKLNLTGTHIGCDTGQCGACTVLLDGRSVKSCMLLAVQADSADVTTVEGLAADGRYHPVQEGFWEKHGLQCGFCTPGLLITAAQLINDEPDPSETQIREAIEGNICRCTGYQNIVEAIKYAVQKARSGEPGQPIGSGVTVAQ
ncbi:MAG: (2Fe-2S)-binding protein [Chloroflexi bacterium]|nr:(2Fe-2S)-binding protein [Chloroflexota bacterium]